jgi:hypothetical protein
MEKIIFEYKDNNEEYALESAWAEKVTGGYKLDNILFYAPEYSWGDIVKIEERNGELYVTGLVEESGHSTVRVLFNNKEDVQPTRDALKLLGCDSELSNIPLLISVDIPNTVDYKPIKQFLDEGEANERWGYEESCLAHNTE